MRREPAELPVGIEAAAHRLASACARDGWSGAVSLTVHDGQVYCVSHVERGKVDDFYELAEGEWFKCEVVE